MSTLYSNYESNSSKFQVTRRGNGCQLCGNESGNCRTVGELHLCMSLAGAIQKGEKENGFYCLGDDKSGMWSMWKIDDFTQSVARTTAPINLDIKKRKTEDAVIKQAKSLTADERHEQYTRLFNELETYHIHQGHVDTLDSEMRQRGCTDEQAKNTGFIPVSPKFKVEQKYSIPGVKEDGSLAIYREGYLIPIKDFLGRIIGCQVRNYVNLKSDDNFSKYSFFSGKDNATPLNFNNEMPLAVYHPVGECKGIAIVEGTGAKPYMLSLQGYLTIGAHGGLHASSPEYMRVSINQALDKYGDVPIIVFPDAGWLQNPSVTGHIKNTIDLLEPYGITLQIADWNQLDKQQGDIDEIVPFPRETPVEIRYLSGEGFEKRYKEVLEGGNRFSKHSKARKSLKADIVQHEKYLSIPKDIDSKGNIICIRAPLGSGKTQAVLEAIKDREETTIWVGSRNTLLHQTVSRAEKLGISAIHTHNMVEKASGTDSTKRVDFSHDSSIKLFAGCLDSFEKLENVNKNANETILTSDEIVSVLGHAKQAGTLKNRQKNAIDWWIKAVNESNLTFFMDANLCDKDIDFLKLIFPDKNIVVIDSWYDSTPRNFYVFETKDDTEDFSSNQKYLSAHILEVAKNLNKFVVASDSQKCCEVTEEIFKKLGKKIIRIDSTTRDSEDTKLFIKDSKQYILDNQIDVVIYSPSAESGLSIDVYDYFQAVFMDIKGTVSINSLLQMSARLRDFKLPVYVACPEFSNLAENLAPYSEEKLKEALMRRFTIGIESYTNADNELAETDFVKNTLAKAEAALTDLWFLETCKDAVKHKYEMSNLKLCFKTALCQDGHNVIDIIKEKDAVNKEEIAATKEEVNLRTATKIFNAPDIEYEKALEYKKLNDRKYEIDLQIYKAEYKHQMPGIENTNSWQPELIKVLKNDASKFLEYYWRLQNLLNPELSIAELKIIGQSKLKNDLTTMNMYKEEESKLATMRELGLTQLIGTVWNAKTPFVKEIAERYLREPKYIEMFPVSIPKKSDKQNMELVKRLLIKFGLEVKKCKTTNGERFYTTVIPNAVIPFIEDINTTFKKRIEQTIEEASKVSLAKIYLDSQAEKQELEIQQKEIEEARNKFNLAADLNCTAADVEIPVYIDGVATYTSIAGF